nr:hypothetical protein [Neoasaia chiangmaiensis]
MRQLSLIDSARVSLHLGERLVSRNGRDLVRRATGFRESAGSRFPQAMA